MTAYGVCENQTSPRFPLAISFVHILVCRQPCYFSSKIITDAKCFLWRTNLFVNVVFDKFAFVNEIKYISNCKLYNVNVLWINLIRELFKWDKCIAFQRNSFVFSFLKGDVFLCCTKYRHHRPSGDTNNF